MKNFFFFLLFLSANFALAQKTVTGIISDKSGKPVKDVSVSVQYTNYRTFSDDEGKYSIEMPAGYKILEFSKKDFRSQEIEVTEKVLNLTLVALSDVKDIYDLSLEELMNVEVTTASKTAEEIHIAAGIISVVTSREIEQFGANNLLEILQRITSTYIVGSFLFPQNVVSVRGNLLTHFNNQTLILINGRPCRESLYSGIDAPIFLAFPIHIIDKIEIVRGPGSVLYGTNAYSGVINILTKENTKETSVHLTGGSFNQQSLQTTHSTNYQGVNVSSGINFFKEDGWETEYIDELDSLRKGKMAERNLGGTVFLHYKNFSSNNLLTISRQNNLGSAPRGNFDYLESIRYFSDIGYQIQCTEKWKTTFNLTLNYFNTDFHIKPPSGIGGQNWNATSTDYLLENTNFLTISSKFNFLIGGTLYYISGNAKQADYAAIPKYEEIWYSAYGQIEYRVLSNLKLIAGGQFNKPENISLDFVPRLGVIYNFRKIGAKLLYSQAFRSAFAAEKSIDVLNLLFGNKELKPEKIATTDFQIFYYGEKIQLSSTFFISESHNIIARVPTQTPANTYRNEGKIFSNGIETEARLIFFENLFINLSHTYQTNEKDDSIKNFTNIPNQMLKAGISYKTHSGISLGIFNIYFSEPSDVISRNKSRKLTNPVPEAYNLLSAKISFDVNKLFFPSKHFALLLNFYGYNLLNKKIYFPEFSRSRVNSISGIQPQSWYCSLVVKF